MKKIILITFTLVCIGIFTNCVKKKNCDCGNTGKFIYVKYNDDNIGESLKARGLKAIIFTDSISNTGFYIYDGSIPKRFRTKDTIKVNFCVELSRGYNFDNDRWELKCIEEIE